MKICKLYFLTYIEKFSIINIYRIIYICIQVYFIYLYESKKYNFICFMIYIYNYVQYTQYLYKCKKVYLFFISTVYNLLYQRS